MVNRTIAPPIKDAVEYDIMLKRPETFSLTNGVKVYRVQAGTEEVVQIEWVFRAGNWFEKKRTIASSTNFLIKNGTSSRSAYEINEFVDFYGAYLNRTCFNETAVITLHCLSKQLEQLLPLVRELITDAIFSEQELTIYRQNMKQKLAVNLKKCDFVAGRKIDAMLFGEHHPYGVFSRTEDYDALDREELRKFYSEYYTHGYCTIFSAGILPSNSSALMERYFGDLPLNTDAKEGVQHAIAPQSDKQ